MENRLKNLEEKLISFRRDFHKYPESRWKEFRTSAKIAKVIDKLGFQIKLGREVIEPSKCIGRPSDKEISLEIDRAISQGADVKWINKLEGYPGVIGYWDTGKPGPTIAFRFDIDALSGSESEDSKHKPVKQGYNSVNTAMHSCGHDGHATVGLGLAYLINERSKDLTGKIVLIFQPSEEGGSGAEAMLASNIEIDYDYFYAIHLCLSKDGRPMKTGMIAGGCNDFLDNRRYNIYFEGKAAHPGGAAQEGKNALLAACTAALNIHAIAPHEGGLMRVNVGQIEAGVARNVIAPNAKLVMEARGENDDIAEYVEKRSLDIIKAAANMYDVEYKVISMGATPSAKSDTKLINLVKESIKNIETFDTFYELGNVGGSDDATCWMRAVQEKGGRATYIGIGADCSAPLHNRKFDFDERVLLNSVEMLYKLIELSL